MKIIITALLLLSILIAYTVPTFYEAYVEHKVLHVARQVASDMIWARRQSIKSGKDYGITFIKGQNPGYSIFSGDFISKKESLSDINDGVKFSDAFDDKGVALKDNKYVFSGGVASTTQPITQGEDSIFLISKSDEEKGIMERVVRIYINKTTNDIKILRVKGKTVNGDVIFTDIGS